MPKTTIHLIRHAQGYHNLSSANHKYPDPSLTPLGVQQCIDLSSIFPSPEKITHLISSPLRRTLYTTLFSFPSLISNSSNTSPNSNANNTTNGNDDKKNLKILALPEIQEASSLPCDTGSELSFLSSEFPSEQVDLSLLTKEWNSKRGPFAPAAKAIEARALSARRFLRGLAEKEKDGEEKEVQMVVVTHGGFLHYFTEDFEGAVSDGMVGTGWGNCEFRTYEFEDEAYEFQEKVVNGNWNGVVNGAANGVVSGHGEDRASLRETDESRARRGRVGVRKTKEEQRELRERAERVWMGDGFQVEEKEEE